MPNANFTNKADVEDIENIEKKEFVVTSAQAGKRFDQVLSELVPEYSRNQHQQWIANHAALLDQQTAKAKDKVKTGQVINLTPILSPQTTDQAQAMPLEIIHEDEDLLVINKPAGLTVHPGAGQSDGTLLNALLHYHQPLQQVPRAGIVHRLDKATTGLMVVAKTVETHHALIKAMQARQIKREYQALVHGVLISGGTVDAPIGRHPTKRTQMAVNQGPNGKSAITHYRVLERFRQYTHLKLQLETGRTHQIRVHMAYIRHAIIGDPVYGTRAKLPKAATIKLIEQLQQFPRQALHASQLSLIHPTTKKAVSWHATLPEDMQHLLDQLKYDTTEDNN